MLHGGLVVFANMVPLTILVVDDDELSRELLRILFTSEGYAVETADSGEEALQLLAGASHVDVVLADLQMPGLSGSTLAHSLRASSHAPRLLLAMSASEPAADQIASYDSFLLKPFSMEALAAAIAINDHAKTDATDAATHSVLNMETYNKLKTVMTPEKLEQLYALCLDDVTRRVAIMRASASAGDDTTYRREAHAIKGGCGMVGAHELQTIAASEENTGLSANYVATLDEIAAATERLKRMLVA
ncbi:MAG TPA: response regulator, partial [Terriglobus sp.]